MQWFLIESVVSQGEINSILKDIRRRYFLTVVVNGSLNHSEYLLQITGLCKEKLFLLFTTYFKN